MKRHFFIGENAIDTILSINGKTNENLINNYSHESQKSIDKFESWLCLNEQKVINKINPFYSNNRQINEEEIIKINEIISSISISGLIPSTENYQVKVSLLNKSEIKSFNNSIKTAEESLIKLIPQLEILIKNLIIKYIPFEHTESNEKIDLGMSTYWFKGSIFFEKKQEINEYNKLENIVHELAHQVIINYQYNDLLIEEDFNKLTYSGILNKNRPAIMAFHGAAALSYMLNVAIETKNFNRTEQILSQLNKTLSSLKQTKFTKLGLSIFNEMIEHAKKNSN
jgi:hypothetical protein